MKKGLLLMSLVISLMFTIGIPAANASVIVEFNEVDLTNLTCLDGTAYFEPWGLAFEDTTFYAIESLFPPAGVDDRGITTTSGPDNLMTVVFTTPAASVTADWITAWGNSIYATAYDSGGAVLDMQSETGLSAITYGTFTFSGLGPIAKITFHDGPGTIGVGRLAFTSVPEPLTICLLGFGGLLLRRRRTL